MFNIQFTTVKQLITINTFINTYIFLKNFMKNVYSFSKL